MSTPLNKSQTPIHIQYRNGTYYGQISPNYKRNGKGLLILDSSTVLFADWKNNQIQGMYIYITDGIRAYGNINNGKLDGYNIINSTNNITKSVDHNNTERNKSFYGMFRNDKIYGRSLVIDNDIIMITQFNNNQLQQILSKKPLRQRQLFEILNDIFPNNLYTLDQYLTIFIKQFIKQILNINQLSRYQPCINYFNKNSTQKFYGFQQINKPNKKFGLIFFNNQIVSIGQHNNNLLQGIGRLYKDQHVYDGTFTQGKLNNIGIDYHILSNKFMFQVNDGIQNKIQKGFGFPFKEISEFRKQFHLRSIYFYNDVAILAIKSKFQQIIGHIFYKRGNVQAEQQRMNSTSYGMNNNRDIDPRINASNSHSNSKRISTTKITNSPLRQRLNKYQLQSDFIQDNNSPIIKNNHSINEYRPVVDRNSNYFQKSNNYNNQNQYEQSNNRIRTNSRFSKNNIQHNDRQNESYYDRSSQKRSSVNLNMTSNSRNRNSHMNNNYINNDHQYVNNNNNRSRQKSIYSNQRFSQQKINHNQNIARSPNVRQQRQKKYYNDRLNEQNNYHKNSNNPRSINQRNSRINQNYNRQEYNGQNNKMMNKSRKHTKDLVKELETQEKQRRLTLDQIYQQSGLYGRNYKK